MSSFPGTINLSDGEARSQTVNQRLPLGSRGATLDGRVFRYCKNAGTAILVGKMVNQMTNDISLDADQDLATSTLYTASLTTASSVIWLRPAATEVVATGVFNEGYLYVNNESGEGQYLMIESQPYVDGTISALMPIHLAPDSRLSQALTTSALVGLVENKYKDVVTGGPDASNTSTMPLGVTVRAVSASYYFWLQTWGPCVVWYNLAAVQGAVVTNDTFTGTGTAASLGAVHTIGTSTDAITGGKLMPIGRVVGHGMAISATTEHALINLEIEP